MEVLEYLQSIRNPILTGIFSVFTACGSEILLLAIMVILYWCFDKKLGLRVAFSYFLSGICIQTIKIIARVPRPWELSSTITPVKSAVKGATGYSFPSGHTQGATSFYATFAYMARKTWVKVLFILLIIGVAISRMYVGVHTPADVSVAFVLTLVISYAFNRAIDEKIFQKFRKEAWVFAVVAISIVLFAIGAYIVKSGEASYENAADQFKIVGAFIGFIIGWYIESEYIDFKTDNKSVVFKILTVIVGAAFALGIRSVLKHFIGGCMVGDFIRYMILVFFAIAIYPLMFEWVHKKTLSKKG